MMKIKQREIRELVKNGMAIEIRYEEDVKEKMSTIAISHGIYGMNGGLFRGNESGKLYAVTSRASVLWSII